MDIEHLRGLMLSNWVLSIFVLDELSKRLGTVKPVCSPGSVVVWYVSPPAHLLLEIILSCWWLSGLLSDVWCAVKERPGFEPSLGNWPMLDNGFVCGPIFTFISNVPSPLFALP